MNWLAVATTALSKLPIERFLVRERSRTESLQELKGILEAAPGGQGPPEPSEAAPEESFVQRRPKVHLTPHPDSVSSEVTVEYQKREIGKLLLRMERHCVQKFRMAGKACECGAQKHLLDLESLSEETIPMVDNPENYYRVIELGRELAPKCTIEAAGSGQYDKEYPTYSRAYRDLRKELLGTLDTSTLLPKRLENSILPMTTEEEEEVEV